MPYCHVPWTNIDISPQGEISPCCKFVNRFYKTKVPNINDTTIEEYLANPILQEVKKNFIEDVWPSGCERCKIEEDNGIESRRIAEKVRWKDHLDNHKERGFITASIAFGNTCNLTCIICDPTASSKWYQEYNKLYGIGIKPNHFYKENFVDNFYSQTPNLIHLDIPGGEPLLSGVNQQQELLSKFCNDGKAENISLHYFTNCTKFPDEVWLNLWSQFKQVELQLSIDGIGNRFEYLRYPGIWSDVETNALRYQELANKQNNIKLSISSTVSAYNIAYLDELIEWSIANGFNIPWLGRVHNPKHLRPSVWKNNGKNYILDKLKNSKYDLSPFVSLIQNEDDSEQFETFRYRLLRHDQYRKLSFKNTFPEMFTFLSE